MYVKIKNLILSATQILEYLDQEAGMYLTPYVREVAHKSVDEYAASASKTHHQKSNRNQDFSTQHD